MRQLFAVLLLWCSVHTMAQVKVEQQMKDSVAPSDSVTASVTDKAKEVEKSKGQVAESAAPADTVSCVKRSIMLNKTDFRISGQDAKRYTRKSLPSFRPIFEDEGLKRLKLRDMNANGDVWTNIGDFLIKSATNK